MNVKSLQDNVVAIDHIALAVPNLRAAITWVKDVLGFELEEERVTQGKRTGMKSAVMRMGPITIVLTEGIGASSQTSQFVESFGPGVQHVALRVKSLRDASAVMGENGLRFSSPRLDSDGLSQIFSERDPSTGLMIELIERRDYEGFRDENVQRLFDALEEKQMY